MPKEERSRIHKRGRFRPEGMLWDNRFQNLEGGWRSVLQNDVNATIVEGLNAIIGLLDADRICWYEVEEESAALLLEFTTSARKAQLHQSDSARKSAYLAGAPNPSRGSRPARFGSSSRHKQAGTQNFSRS
jgi:hypothetical protein